MRITLFAAGSRGDIQPCVMLARALQAVGFELRLAAPENFAGFIEENALRFLALRGDAQQIMASETGRMFMETGGANPIRSIRAMRTLLGPVAMNMAEDLLEACRDTDALISLGVFAPLAKTIVEVLHIPLVLVEPTPLLPSRAFPAPGWPLQKNLGGLHNRLSGWAMLQVIWQWYRPYLNQFLTPDTIIPDPYNPLDLDRYSYVRNSPVNFNDPTGYKPCDGQNSGAGECDQITTNDLEEVISWTFGWTTKGDFSIRDLGKIIDAGTTISNYVSSITNNWGTGWVRSNLGNAVFEQDWWSNWFDTNVVKRPASTWPYTILLKTGSWSVNILIHELGHVLDNNFQKIRVGPATFFGGGAADKMVKDMGGNPSLCYPRFACTGYSPNQYFISIAGNDPWNPRTYGSTSVAEDFAETFVNTIVNSSIVPSGRLKWMENFISQ